MKKIKILIFLFLLVLLQSTFLDQVRIFNVKPDLILAAVIISGFSRQRKQTLMLSIIAGFLKDILSTGPLGLNTLIFVLIGFATTILSKRFLIENIALRMVIIALAVFLGNIIAQCVLSFYASPISLGIFLKLTFVAAAYTAFLSYPIIKIIYT